MQRAEPMAPRAGSDQVSEVRADGTPAPAPAPAPAAPPSLRRQAADQPTRSQAREPRRAARPGPHHARGVRGQEARPAGADVGGASAGLALRRALRSGAGAPHRRGGGGHPSDRLAGEPQLAAPRLAFVLGSGLGGVVDLLDPGPRLRIPYREIPHVPGSDVAGHAGSWSSVVRREPAVLILSGRAHAYEGWCHRQSTLLLRACFAGDRDAGAHQRIGRHQPGLRSRRRDAHQRHHQPVRREPAAGPEPGSFRAALRLHGRRLGRGAARPRAGRRRAGGRAAARGRLPDAVRPRLRDPRGAAHAAHAWRRCGRHVDRPRGAGGAPHGRAGAGLQPRHQQGDARRWRAR